MEEEYSYTPTPRDELYEKQASGHQERLSAIAQNAEGMLSPEEIFSDESDKKVSEYAAENSERLPEVLNKFLDYYLSIDSSRSSGHEAAHIYDNLASALKSFKGRDLPEISKLEVALACIGHDLGRHVEPSTPDISRDKTELLMPLAVGRKMMKQLGVPESLGKRVLYDIANAKKRPGRLETEIVGQSDRVYATGSAVFIRDLAFGLIRENEDYPMRMPSAEELPEYESYKTTLKNPYAERVPLKHFHFEFMMRNVFPPVTENMRGQFGKAKIETAVILMIASLDRPEVRDIFFAPEEGLVPDDQLGRFKKKMDPDLYARAKEEFDRFVGEIDMNSYRLGDELEMAKKAMAIEKIIPPENFDEIFKTKVSGYSDADRRNLWLQIHYAIRSRHNGRLEELGQLKEPAEGIEGVLSERVKAEFDDRERIYGQLYAQKDSGSPDS